MSALGMKTRRDVAFEGRFSQTSLTVRPCFGIISAQCYDIAGIEPSALQNFFWLLFVLTWQIHSASWWVSA